jgi:MoaA/NifB/PqqE/SkfB family radical SAM enzyme
VPLAVREDWQELLAAAATLGTTTVWVAFHGLGVEHDRQVNRPGAYAETGLAIQRVHTAGLRAGANVFVTTANAGQAERLLETLGRLGVDQMAWEPATYYPTLRGRRTERLRPRPSELLPLVMAGCRRAGGPLAGRGSRAGRRSVPRAP